MSSSTLLVTVVPAAASLAVGIISAISARNAQRTSNETQRRQQDSEDRERAEQQDRQQALARAEAEAQAFARARESYEHIVRDLEAQLERNQRTVERMQNQLDVVMGRLATEQDISHTLRNQIRTLNDQIADLQAENAGFREKIAELQRVNDALDAELRQAAAVPTVPTAAN